LEAKVLFDVPKLHPLIDEFVPTLEGENRIYYTRREKLPGLNFILLSNFFSCLMHGVWKYRFMHILLGKKNQLIIKKYICLNSFLTK